MSLRRPYRSQPPGPSRAPRSDGRSPSRFLAPPGTNAPGTRLRDDSLCNGITTRRRSDTTAARRATKGSATRRPRPCRDRRPHAKRRKRPHAARLRATSPDAAVAMTGAPPFAGRRGLGRRTRATRATDTVRSRAAGVKPRERLVRGPATRAGVEVLARLLGVGGRRPVGGQPRESRRVAGTPVAGEVGQQLAVDGGVRPLEEPGVLAVHDAERRDDLVG